jgi:hypothetical protein
MAAAILASCLGCAQIQEFQCYCQTRHRASAAFAEAGCGPRSGPLARHFERGWKQGYCDVACGGSGCCPLLPPPEYWTCKYQGPEGGAMIDTWRHAYEMGAQTALEHNAGQWHYVPCFPSPMVCATAEPYQPHQKGYEEIAPPPPVAGLLLQSHLHADAANGPPLLTQSAPLRLPATDAVEQAFKAPFDPEPAYASRSEAPYSEERSGFGAVPHDFTAQHGFSLAQGPELFERLSYVEPLPPGAAYGARPPFSPLTGGAHLPPPALLQPHHPRVLRDFPQ